MATIVQKYGGSSVGDAERIKRVAERVVASASAGDRICVVVSAMGDATDDLFELAAEVSSDPHERELDMLLTAGERISMALVSMAIIDLGREALSFTGAQAGIITDATHGRARIVKVDAARVASALDSGTIAIVAGFQGVSTTDDVTTLGRGGSDMTAVALAAALGADVCEIYTDVDGVFTADPRLVSDARRLAAVSYEEMLELATSGARVLMSRCVETARNHGIPIHVRSSLSDGEGTWVTAEGERLEQAIIAGIAHDTSEAKVTVTGVPDRPGIAARVFRPLADAGVNIDMIVQNVSAAGHTDISFTLPKEDLRRAQAALEQVRLDVGALDVVTDDDIARVSLVGAGMKTHPGVAADMFDALADAGINIEIISTSPIRISCVVRAADIERAVKVVHERFRLADPPIYREEPTTAVRAPAEAGS
jgi:aspartate kinase